jgi:hypothetical protein
MQAPGPPGFPQEPQASGRHAGADGCDDVVAKTEIFLSSFWPWQAGHSAVSPERTSFSNSFPQLEQRYSNMGMSFAIK